MLWRAFGPASRPPPDRLDATRAAALAHELGLAERIGARIPSSALVAELGRERAQPLALSRLQVLARVRGLCDLIPELASLAETAAIPIVLLKFAALHAGGHLLEGSRAAADIDVLVREDDAAPAAEILRSRGFFAGETVVSDHHHLPPLRDRAGRVAELHTRLPGLRRPGERRFAGYETLEAAGGLEPAPGLGRGCHLLRRDLLAAHAIAHGFAQHGGADVYPVSRALADVIDVLPAERRATGIAAAEWIAADMPLARLEAVLGLCDALEKGDLEGLDDGPEARPEGALLRHVLASALDPDYRRSLAVGHVFRSPTDEPRFWRLLKTVQALAVPTRGQLAARLGVPSPRLVTGRLRVANAVTFARRLPSHGRAALRAAWNRLTSPGGTHA